ncbi:MAG: gamma-glutamylcyclotransferase [Candidatus Acidiferrum sp.]|jgi:gamma-glutamylcyclotransferase (GGCT)/AIG2-like uncharacterized protein YtfP
MRAERNPEHLFVYGTLKRGERNHARLLQHAVEFAGTARIRGELYQLAGETFPGAVPSDAANSFVHGELFALYDPEETLASLDEFEGVDEGEFARRLVDAWTAQGQVKTWVYFYAQPLEGASQIGGGMYSSL